MREREREKREKRERGATGVAAVAQNATLEHRRYDEVASKSTKIQQRRLEPCLACTRSGRPTCKTTTATTTTTTTTTANNDKTHGRRVLTAGDGSHGGHDLSRLDALLHALELRGGLHEAGPARLLAAPDAGGLLGAADEAVLFVAILATHTAVVETKKRPKRRDNKNETAPRKERRKLREEGLVGA